MGCTVSILISTRNRAESLRGTLLSLDRMSVPTDVSAELILVDNGSTDDTVEVVNSFHPESIACRLLHEPNPSKSVALNQAIDEAKGDFLLFTDDDVRVPPLWIQGMVEPMHHGGADAVAGGVRIAPSRQREWMTAEHAAMLADTTTLQESGGQRMVGANMAVGRHVFDRVGKFDPNLGPGESTVGLHEETLLSLQLRRSGFEIALAFDVTVDHYIEEERLLYPAFKDIMTKQGQSDAYLDYHWRHNGENRVRSSLAAAYWYTQYALLSFRSNTWREEKEGMRPEEMDIWRRIAYHKQMFQYAGQPRNYTERYGLQRK